MHFFSVLNILCYKMKTNSKREKSGSVKTDALGRRVWDKDIYQKKAEEREKQIELDVKDIEALDDKLHGTKKKEKFQWQIPLEERKLLLQRDKAVTLDKDLHKKQVVTAYSKRNEQGGYWCDICEALLKDSKNWLDHINGEQHQR